VIVLAMNAFQSLGTMITSSPALMACGQLAFVQPGTCPMPFQSDTARPSKPILPLRIPLMALELPWSLPSVIPRSVLVQLLKEIITAWAPAASAP
jgi:hypothetical protein